MNQKPLKKTTRKKSENQTATMLSSFQNPKNNVGTSLENRKHTHVGHLDFVMLDVFDSLPKIKQNGEMTDGRHVLSASCHPALA